MERAREWWRDYGRAIVAGAVIGLSAVVGFNYWQHREQTRAESASDLFETMHELLATHATEVATAEAEAEAAAAAKEAEENAEDDAGEDEETAGDDSTVDETETAESDGAEETAAETADESTETVETDESTEPEESETAAAIRDTAEELMADYAATPYAVHAAFALAKLSVERGELAPAAQSLQWILDHTGGDDAVLRHIARLRLASVLLAQNEAERAIELLRRPVDATTGFTARYDELRGDAHLQSGDSDAARDAYRRGLDALSADSIGHFLLKLKLDNLGG
ncbi:MAG: tetratricopeptide repeat protein [Gammaproteobacteria bacterium]|nr:tetratricopeptide repeat protein [Gammaproteobacteria bacterium]